MALDVEMGALIGGCVAGGVVFIIFVAVIIYLLCGKRRRKKEEQKQQKFRQLTPHTSPAHSQPSSLSQAVDPPPPSSDHPLRLPKVGSYGLWVGAPGIYASTPSPAYAYGGGGGKSGGKAHPLMQPAVMQSASSDPRLLHSRGPGVYSAGGGQQRIYHSQGIPSPLSPVYELSDHNDGSVYDVYQIGGGSTTRLLQDSSKSSGKRVQRSQSDVVSEPIRRAYRTKPSPAHLRASRASSSHRETSPGSTVKETNTSNMQSAHGDDDGDGKNTERKGGGENPKLIEDVEKIMEEDKMAVAASATDSMKLLAKNKTDDQKTVRRSSASDNLANGVPSGSAPPPPSAPEGNVSPASPSSITAPPELPDSPTLHYTVQGDIYAVPDKKGIRNRSASSNPSSPGEAEAPQLEEAPATALEGATAAGVEGATAGPVTDILILTGSLLIDRETGYAKEAVIDNQICQKVGENEHTVTRGSVYDIVDGVAIRRSEGTTTVVPGDGVGGVALPSAGGAVATPGEAEASSSEGTAIASTSGGAGASSQPDGQKKLLDKFNIDTELISAGKHINVTAEAFLFLDTYLSDEEGTDVNSPPRSPSPDQDEDM